MSFRVLTFAVALVFSAIGVIVLGAERLLRRIRCLHEALCVKEMAGAWRLLDGLHTLGALIVLLVMGGGLFAMIKCLRDELSILAQRICLASSFSIAL